MAAGQQGRGGYNTPPPSDWKPAEPHKALMDNVRVVGAWPSLTAPFGGDTPSPGDDLYREVVTCFPGNEPPKPEIVVGDLNSDARGAGARANAGKAEFHQIPLFALDGVARVLMYGAKKYKAGNWAKGMDWMILFDCFMRHMAAWQRGEENDPESGLPHLDHALCNLIFLSAYRDLYPEGDNRWPQLRKGGVRS